MCVETIRSVQNCRNGLLWQVLNGKQGDALQLVWISSIGTQAMRVVLGYTRMYAHFEGYVHRTLHDQQVGQMPLDDDLPPVNFCFIRP